MYELIEKALNLCLILNINKQMSDLNFKPSELLNDNNPLKKIGQFRLIINMFKDHFNKTYFGLASWVIPVIIITLIYVISPIDIIPDIPFIGYIDDAALLAIVYKFIGKEVKKYEEWRKNNIEVK